MKIKHAQISNAAALKNIKVGDTAEGGGAYSGNTDSSPVSRAVDITSAVFNPRDPDLLTSWSTGASTIICLNSYQNGITLSLHRGESLCDKSDRPSGTPDSLYAPNAFHLRLKETRDFQLPHGKHHVFKESPEEELTEYLTKLKSQGRLSGAVCYLGTVNDPFFAFHRKFTMTMACLSVLERLRPTRILVQTRSPMVIAGLAMFKLLAESLVVVIPLESHMDAALHKYTPGHAKVAERIVAADGLRSQGIKVNFCASPLMPYGDFYRDAWDFAEILCKHSDYVTLGALGDGTVEGDRALKNIELARALAQDRHYRILRPHSYRSLFAAVKAIAPEKLKIPPLHTSNAQQLDMFGLPTNTQQ